MVGLDLRLSQTKPQAFAGGCMTNPISLTLKGVSWQLPDGSFLFSELNEQFDGRHTGLVGRNGVGKSALARILAGAATPTSGRCARSEEHTSELQSLMRISYAVFCLKKKKQQKKCRI